MKILILGHGRHGKDEAAKILKSDFGFKFKSSSEFALHEVIWPKLSHRYVTPEKCFNDRSNHRALWKQLICEYNSPDKAKLAKAIIQENDVYVGMRCDEEYAASKHLFDKIIWVHRVGFPAEPEMKIQYDPSIMKVVVNAGSLELMRSQLLKIMQ